MGRLSRKLERLARGPYYHDWHLLARVAREHVYLMSFARSGNSWVRCLVTSYVADAPVTPALVEEVAPGVHYGRRLGRHYAQDYPQARMFKSHSPYVSIPGRVIYLVRDGRAATVSLHAYVRALAAARGESNWYSELSARDFFFATGHPHGVWYADVPPWLDGLETWPRDRWMILRYEEVLADPEQALAATLEFLRIPVDAGRVTRAVARNSKDELAAIEAQAGAGALDYPGLTTASWQEILKGEDLVRYEELAGSALLRAGYALASTEAGAPRAPSASVSRAD